MNINLEDILAWDLETVPKEEFNEEHPLFETWKNRNRKEKLTTDELLERFSNEGGLYGEYLTIVCLSCAFVHKGEIRVNSYMGDEKQIIDEFLKVAEFIQNRSVSANRKGLINLGHNVINYDIPVARKVYSRYYNMFSYPDYVSDLDTKSPIPQPKKSWVIAETNLDTLQIQKGGNYMFSSMAETAINLGLPSPKLDTDGSQVATLFRNGEFERIRVYCENDVLTSIKILFSWMGQEMLPIAQKQEVIEAVDLPLLQKIYKASNIDNKTKEDLQKKLVEKKITKKDRVIIEDILISLYIDNTMFKSDSEPIKESKRNEIKELLNEY
jgi:predicted PolB exonuclease-like 3'-5' exonuclease